MSVIKAERLGKRYTVGERQRYLALRDTLTDFMRSPMRWARAKMGKGGKSGEFWALRDVSFEVEKGEVLGIIGRNGAGKSTLLKILSRITPPTEGTARLSGTVGSLLEVGTGFHPELTGRENIFLNGAILGMRRQEIIRKLDPIIEFSGVEKFIDTPVKRYSSGMYVRLAFSVAAHLETEILVIDEVLAVGDAEFQKRCLGKMDEVTREEGRTVLFVSHNMSAVKSLCGRAILLKEGRIQAAGGTDEVIRTYAEDTETVLKSQVELKPDFGKDVTFTKIWVTDSRGNVTNEIGSDEDFRIWVEFQVNKPTDETEISLVLRNSSNVNVVFTSLSDGNGRKFVPFGRGRYVASAGFRGNFLLPDNYAVRLSAHLRGTRDIDVYHDALRIMINETAATTLTPYGHAAKLYACVFSDTDWRHEKISD